MLRLALFRLTKFYNYIYFDFNKVIIIQFPPHFETFQ